MTEKNSRKRIKATPIKESKKEKHNFNNSERTLDIQEKSLLISKRANYISIASVIITALIALVGILVSYYSYQTYQSQLILEKQNSRPIFNIEILYNDNNSKIDGLQITNEGALTGNIEVDIIPFLCVCTEDLNSKDAFKSSKTVFLPIKSNDYYIHKYNTKKGLICNADFSAVCKKTIDDFNEMFQVDSFDTSKEFVITQISVEYFININYKDILENDCNELYLCVPNYHIENNIETKNNHQIRIIEMTLRMLDSTDSLNEIFEKMGKPNTISTRYNIAYYTHSESTPSNQLIHLKECVAEAYKQSQFIN